MKLKEFLSSSFDIQASGINIIDKYTIPTFLMFHKLTQEVERNHTFQYVSCLSFGEINFYRIKM